MLILLIASLAPAIVLLAYVYHKDTVEKEPPALVLRLFLLGAVAGPLAAVSEQMLITAFEAAIPPGLILLIVENFIGVAMIEEGFKYLFLFTVRDNPEFNYVFDGVVYAVAVALGFAALENIFYVFDGGLEVAAMRAILAVPGHAADGVVMGCFFGLAKHRQLAGNERGASNYYRLAFLLPVIEHGFYDCALSSGDSLAILLAIAVQLSFIIFAMVLVNHTSKNDRPLESMGSGIDQNADRR